MEPGNVQSSPVSDYAIPGGCRDELIGPDGAPLPHAELLMATLQRLGPAVLEAAGQRRDTIFMQQGITFEVASSDGQRRDRAWPLDLVPRVITAAEWTTIKRGLAQRIRALNAFVDDVYHAHEIVRAGIVPWSLIVSRPSFARPVHGVRAPGGVYTHVCGCDLVRDGDGHWRVLEDNVRTPSGISYVLENRVAMTRLMPELFAGHRVRAVDHYPSLLLDALRAVAPATDSHPTVVLWTPGPLNSAYFEHAFLARQMGVELVEPGDLVVRDAVCYMRTTAGLQRVHTIYRRLDDDFIDPLEFRPDSMLGVPGLVRAYRAGTVAIANAIGTGVADDKAIYYYVPEMIRFYLSEEPILENVPTYLLSDERQRRHVLGRLHEIVVKPTSESGGKGVFIGPQATQAEREQQARMIEDDPHRFIAQELVHLSTAPTEAGGRLVPRHVDLRPFAVFGEEIRIVPGGLTRVALREGSMIVNSSQGGGSKDTWVLDDDSATDLAPGTLPTHRPPRLPDVRYGGWQSQAQQQQQSGRTPPDDPPQQTGAG
ncbi:MAG TPA: circularly permuted type 2 ATP-grasp protein [Solirubrobacteraceae bacterium]|nr:circularly permuted type 2 ATP-grasp protein [Solirubrobacteraceae bacterium]